MAGPLTPDIEAKLRRWDMLSPSDPDVGARWRASSRLPSLQGKVAGFLGNRKANADALLGDLRGLMEARFELGDAVVTDKFIYSRPASNEIIDALSARCDFVVTAIAD